MRDVEVVGYQATKHGYVAFCEQATETEEQLHTGLKVHIAYCKFQPKLHELYNLRYYDKTGKEYIFEK